MKKLYIAPTHQSPEILFDLESGEFKICGKSVMEEVEDFFEPVISWLEESLDKSSTPLRFKFNLEYFNIASSKRLLFILYQLNELHNAGKDIHIEWHYCEEDEDMKEVGEDFACMVNLPFNFKSYAPKDLIK